MHKLRHSQKKLLAMILLTACFLLPACGKIVQQSEKDRENPTFDLEYSVKATEKKAEEKTYLSAKNTLYVSVSAISKMAKKKQESWGKAVPRKGASSVYSSKAYTESGMELTSESQRKWSKPTLKSDKNMYKWSIKSNKIKRGYPLYLIAVFENSSKYRLAIIDENTVSQNSKVSLGDLDLYTTFLSVMSIMRMHDGHDIVPNLTMFKNFFSQEFFGSIVYLPPANISEKFSEKKPVFRFNRDFETVLLSLWDLVLVDFNEAELFLKALNNRYLSESSKNILLKNLIKIKQDIEEKQTEG